MFGMYGPAKYIECLMQMDNMQMFRLFLDRILPPTRYGLLDDEVTELLEMVVDVEWLFWKPLDVL